MGEAGSDVGRRPPWLIRRKWWVATPLICVALAGSAVFAVFAQPLTLGCCFSADRGTTPLVPVTGDAPALQLDYVDNQLVTVAQWVANTGRFGLTVTGVDTTPPHSEGLLRITGARSWVPPGPWTNEANLAAALAAPEFKPFHLDSDQEAAIVFQVVTGNCEYNPAPGLTEAVDRITVHYSSLGWPHTEDLLLRVRLAVAAPSNCPRTAPQPSGAVAPGGP